LAKRVSGDVKELEIEGTQPSEMAAVGVDAVPQQAERGAREAEEAVARTILLSEDQILAEARAALDRLDARTFGACERCGHAISQARLNAIPYARFCISCAATQSDGGAR
jgi:RNA polymerase-binding transcription factor DksA